MASLFFCATVMAADKQKSRIEAARSLSDVLDAGKKIRGREHRQAYLHDKIEDAVHQVCKTEGSKANHFTAQQIECLSSICFQVAFILDPSNSPRRGFFGSIRDGWGEAALAARLGIITATITIVGTLLTVGAGAYRWAYSIPSPPQLSQPPLSLQAPKPLENVPPKFGSVP